MSAKREVLSIAPKSVLGAISQRKAVGQPTLSFEFFPPKDQDGADILWRNYSKLLEVSPDFVSVTYGAGGSNRETSLGVVDRMAKDILTVGHLTCVGSTYAGSREIIKHFEQAGVGSILALRGDSPKHQPDALSRGELKTALELVELVRAESNLEVGVAAFPEKHPESPSLAHDAAVLALKQIEPNEKARRSLFVLEVESSLRNLISSHQACIAMKSPALRLAAAQVIKSQVVAVFNQNRLDAFKNCRKEPAVYVRHYNADVLGAAGGQCVCGVRGDVAQLCRSGLDLGASLY